MIIKDGRNMLAILFEPAVMVAAATAIGLFGGKLIDWLRGRQTGASQAHKTDAEAGAILSGAWKVLADQLRSEMTARDMLCDARITQIEARFEHQLNNLRSLVYALAIKVPLTPVQKAMLAEIAPETT